VDGIDIFYRETVFALRWRIQSDFET